jgi:hypothetical protein
MAGGDQLRDEPAAERAAGACDEDSHWVLLTCGSTPMTGRAART